MRALVPALLTLTLLTLLPTPVSAQTDKEGATDHPVVPRLAGGQYYIEDHEVRDFGAGDFYVKDEEQRVEGRYTKVGYWLKEGGKPYSGIEIGRNYQRAIADRGGETLHFELDNSGGTATFRFVAGNRRIWVGVDVSNNGEVYELEIVEETAMAQSVQLNASELAAALGTNGRVSLAGILFDTGLATLRPESTTQLEQVAQLLTDQPALALEIVGHTDNTGTAAGNLTLSQQRADAVKAWLVATRGIAATRLTAVGRGDTQPVADNATEAGRASNRRVEVVKR